MRTLATSSGLMLLISASLASAQSVHELPDVRVDVVGGANLVTHPTLPLRVRTPGGFVLDAAASERANAFTADHMRASIYRRERAVVSVQIFGTISDIAAFARGLRTLPEGAAALDFQVREAGAASEIVSTIRLANGVIAYTRYLFVPAGRELRPIAVSAVGVPLDEAETMLRSFTVGARGR